MVDIISRRDGPRREDAAARHLIDQNRGNIHRLADQLTGGGFSASRAAAAAAPAAPEPHVRRVHAWAGAAAPAEEKPYLRISRNGRVVVACSASGRQLHLLGELRGKEGRTRFVLATEANGFISPLPPDVVADLADLDGCEVGPALPEERLAQELSGRLGLTA